MQLGTGVTAFNTGKTAKMYISKALYYDLPQTEYYKYLLCVLKLIKPHLR